jgi:protein-S-isoprenylcysteine O-methyltransferase Ste14
MNGGALTPGAAIAFAWAGWALSWIAAAAWTARTVARPAYLRQLPSRMIMLIGALVLFVSLGSQHTFFPVRWTIPAAPGWALFACVLAGMAFAWWARLSLGALWSGAVTRKEDHRIVDTGAFALVRHPIYTGILFSMFATALERGRIEPLIGAVLLAAGLWMQARLEESFLAGELGGGAYAEYRARVPMLIPFVKGRA